MTSGVAGLIPGESVDSAGVPWTIRRAWPGKDGTVTLEAQSPASRHVRGGTWTESTGVLLGPVASDRRLPDLRAVAETGTVVVHRPGRRAVVRSHDGARYTKVVRPGRASAVVDAATNAAGFARVFRTAAIVGVGEGTVEFTAVPGRTLHDLGSDSSFPDVAWLGLWRSWGDAWVAAISATLSAPVPSDQTPDGILQARIHTAADEAEVVASWGAHATASASDPVDHERIRRMVDGARALLVEGVAGPTALSHRDLHDKQVLWHHRHGLALLDLDTVTIADAALDLGNVRAHLELRFRQGVLDGRRAQVAKATVDDTAHQLGVSDERLAAYETAARVRIACVYAYRPRWAALALDLRRELADELHPQRRHHG